MAAESSKIKYIFYFNDKKTYKNSVNAFCREVIFNNFIEDARDCGYLSTSKTPTRFNKNENHISMILKEEYTQYFNRLIYSSSILDPLRPNYQPDIDIDSDTQLYFGLYKYAIFNKRKFFTRTVVPFLQEMTYSTVKVGYRKLQKFSGTRVASVKPVDHLINNAPLFNAIVFRSNGLMALEYMLTYIILWRLYDPDYFIADETIDVKKYKTKFPELYEEILYDKLNTTFALMPKTPIDLVYHFAYNPGSYLNIDTSHIREDIYMLLFYILTRKYTFPVLGDFITKDTQLYDGLGGAGLLRMYFDAIENEFNTEVWWIRSDAYDPEVHVDPTKHIKRISNAAEKIKQLAKKTRREGTSQKTTARGKITVQSQMKLIFHTRDKRTREEVINSTCREVIYNSTLDFAENTGYQPNHIPGRFNKNDDYLSILLKQNYTSYFDRLEGYTLDTGSLHPIYYTGRQMDEISQTYFNFLRYAINEKIMVFKYVVLPSIHEILHHTAQTRHASYSRFLRTGGVHAKDLDKLVNNGENKFNVVIFLGNGFMALEYALVYIILWRLYNIDYFVSDEIINIQRYKSMYGASYTNIIQRRVDELISSMPKTPLDIVLYFCQNPELYLDINAAYHKKDIYMLLFYMLTRKATLPIIGDYIARNFTERDRNTPNGMLLTYIQSVEKAFGTSLDEIQQSPRKIYDKEAVSEHVNTVTSIARMINQLAVLNG